MEMRYFVYLQKESSIQLQADVPGTPDIQALPMEPFLICYLMVASYSQSPQKVYTIQPQEVVRGTPVSLVQLMALSKALQMEAVNS